MMNKEIVTEIINSLDLKFSTRKGTKITKDTLIDCWSKYRVEPDYKYFGYSGATSIYYQYNILFKEYNKSNSRECWKAFILRLHNYKCCPKCRDILKLKDFHSNKNKIANIQSICKKCSNINYSDYYKINRDKVLEKSAKDRAAKLQRTPSWLTEDDNWIMQEIYSLAKLREECTGIKWHVDHKIPLQGKLVSGLHVPNNLQVITARDNLSKSNKYVVE